MTMIRYYVDLEDDAARAFVYDLRKDKLARIGTDVADQLEKQIPIPTDTMPENPGAVVESMEGIVYQRWTYDAHSGQPWRVLNDDSSELSTGQLGRIVKVHFEGVPT